VASRLPRLRRLARLACAAFGIAASMSVGAARAQQVDGDLGLRGELTADSSGEAGPEPPGGGNPPEPEVKPAKNALPALKPYEGAQRLDQVGGPKGVSGGVSPPPTVAPSTAVLAVPPPTVASKPLATFCSPPPTVAPLRVAMLPEPPPTVAL